MKLTCYKALSLTLADLQDIVIQSTSLKKNLGTYGVPEEEKKQFLGESKV